MTENFFTGFMPLKVTRDEKIKKLERDLVGVVAIEKDCRVVENDLEPSRALVEFGVVGGDATAINRDGVEIGEFSLNFGVGGEGGGNSLNVGGDFGGVGDGGGGEGFSPINEIVRCPPEILFTRGEFCTVGAEGCQAIMQYFGFDTPDVVKRRKRQISKALTSAKKKAKNTLRVMAGDQIKRQHVDVYKRINSHKIRDIK
ncbi:hypothetical protein HAX54_035684 [Datura stramonium]|uniref:Uncharacterized protein n=1 Tax=Datura stramonium TaxID=4076 RepID=A0ABS8SFW2_DATST|nr:hypothetical protein [Datura stramonium]